MKENIDCEYYDEELECCRKLSDWSQPMPVLQPCVESPCEYFKSISVNKQIDEMAQDMYNLLPDDDVNERDCRDAAKEMFAKGYRKQSEWISVDERLPEESCKCLAVSRIGDIYLAPYSDRYKAFNATDEDGCDVWKLDNITHWMPLPEPPKGVANEN